MTLAVEQDGFVRAAIDSRLFVDDTSWLSKWISGLEAADFTTANWGEQDQPVNESGLTLRLPVAEVDGPGALPELDLEFRVSARVRNAASPGLNDLTGAALWVRRRYRHA